MNRLQTLLPLFLVMLALSLAQAGCASLRGGSQTPAVFGTWNFTMTSFSQGTFTGVMTVHENEDGSYGGRIAVVELDIDDAMTVHALTHDAAAFMLHATVAGNEFTLTGTADKEKMTGTNDVVGVGEFTFEATRAGEQ